VVFVRLPPRNLNNSSIRVTLVVFRHLLYGPHVATSCERGPRPPALRRQVRVRRGERRQGVLEEEQGGKIRGHENR